MLHPQAAPSYKQPQTNKAVQITSSKSNLTLESSLAWYWRHRSSVAVVGALVFAPHVPGTAIAWLSHLDVASPVPFVALASSSGLFVDCCRGEWRVERWWCER